MVKAATPARWGVNIPAEVVALVERARLHLVAANQGWSVAALVTIGAEIVTRRPDLAARAAADCAAGGRPGALAYGQTVAGLALPAPVALPEGWEIERIGHLLTLLAPGGAIIARIDSGGMHLWFTSYHSPTVLGAAIAAFVAAAGGAS